MNIFEGPRQAEAFAAEVHNTQKRKGKDIPYIEHPRRVTDLLARVGAAREIITAGWLHDTIEDQGVSALDIRQRFGAHVARMVLDVTEPNKTLPWEFRKSEAVEHVKHMPFDSLLLKTADVIANTEETTEDYRKVGDVLFTRFHASKEKQLLHKKLLVDAITKAWPENPLLSLLTSVYREFTAVCGGV